MSTDERHKGFHGPKLWVISTLVGLLIGAGVSFIAPAQMPTPHDTQEPPRATETPVHNGATDADHGRVAEDDHNPTIADSPLDAAHRADPAPHIPLWLVVPFVTMLGSIAIMPFINERFWHHHFPDFAFGLGGLVVGYYLTAFDSAYHGMTYGQYHMMHTGLEYYSFIALIGGLYVASGGILIDVKGRGRPSVNTLLLAFGAILANIVGTTGASVLLIRPFMRINKGRLRPMHIVFFIFIVSNCGGALTPIGDPPLYLGYLKGVPFMWTLSNLWPAWGACIAMLLLVFFVYDWRVEDLEAAEAMKDQVELGSDESPTGRLSVRIKGFTGIAALALIIAGVFVDPMLKRYTTAFVGIPLGATWQILVAAGAYFIADRAIHKANEFNFFPVKEVGLLFVGIFATMAPALGFLAANSEALGLNSPTAFYFGTGSLSGVLDNAPTYLNFLQVAFGERIIDADSIATFLSTPEGVHTLSAISCGAVFFGAMTYIGNGPNFMVKAIAEASGVRMPSFFGYLARSILVLTPILVIIWFIFFR